MNKPQDFEEVLARLPDAKQRGDRWEASCPLQGHKTPEKHVSLKDAHSQALITCHGGKHNYQDFCKAWGYDNLAYTGNNGHKLPPGQKEIEDIYIYHDVNGRPSFEVVRYRNPKDFRQRRPDSNGGYIWNLDGIERTLYRNIDLPAAIGQRKPIYIAEGEKDVNRLRKLGFTAICNVGGAGKWLPQYTTALKGADLIIIPDKDKPGYEHGQKVAQACHGIATRVRVLELPGTGKDVSDWLDAGGTAEQLLELTEACPTWMVSLFSKQSASAPSTSNEVTLRCMKDVRREHVSWLWMPYIAVGKLTLLEGDPGIGKSWITLAIATAISLGKGLPGQMATEPGNVILVSAEDGLGDTIGPRLDAMKADGERIHAIDGAISFDDAGFALIENYIDQVNPRILIVDPLVAYLGAGMDFHRANETRPVMSRLAKLAEKYELAILAVRHLAKGGMNKAIYRGIGSIDFTAACRSVLLAGCDSEDSNNLAVVHIKSNLAAKGPSQGYQLRDDNFSWTGESNLTSTQILAGDDSSGNLTEIDEAIAFLKEELIGGPVPASNVYRDAESAGLSKRTLNRAKSQMRILSKCRGEKGKRGGPTWTWELPPDDLDCHSGNLNNKGDGNINNATLFCGNLNNSEANKSMPPKNLATLIGEKTVTNEDSYDGPQSTPPDLIMPREKIIGLWISKGRPVVLLNPGELCQDLQLLLSNENMLPRHIEAINGWYIKVEASDDREND